MNGHSFHSRCRGVIPAARHHLLLAVLLAALWPSAVCSAQPPDIYVAKIYRDDVGVGHVYGERDVDVAYGLGNLLARDKPLRTMFALTAATGRLAEAIGRDWKQASDSYWVNWDRRVRAYQVPQKAQALWNRYLASQDADEIKIRDMIIAYVEGIKDGINLLNPEILASKYKDLAARADWPYRQLDFSEAQFKRLLQRSSDVNNHEIEYWEPSAALLYWLGRVSDALTGLKAPSVDLTEAMAGFFSFGSASWGITDQGNDQGFGYLQASSQTASHLGHTVRFKATGQGETMDGAGVMWEGLGPFLINGACTKNVAWATLNFFCDDIDNLKFKARYDSNSEKYQYDVGPASGPADWKDLTPQTLSILYYDFDASPPTLKTIQKTVYYLDASTSAPGSAVLWAAFPDNDEWNTSPSAKPTKSGIQVTRLACLEPGLTGANQDPRHDPARTLYEMLTAPHADDLVADAFGKYPLGYPLTFMVGSGKLTSLDKQQLLTLPTGRVPFRNKEYFADDPAFFLNYQSPLIDVQQHHGVGWISTIMQVNNIQTTLMFHPLGHFPIVRAHNPPVQQPVIKFMVNNNVSPQWLFARKTPFPSEDPGAVIGKVEPRYKMIMPGQTSPYQELPLFPVSGEDPWEEYLLWLQRRPPDGVSPSIALSFAPAHLAYAFGQNTIRQCWAVNRLKELYEGPGPNPRKITEQDMKALINNRIDWVAYYFHRMELPPGAKIPPRNWFELAIMYIESTSRPDKAQLVALMQEFDSWASPEGANADLTDDSLTPAKWHYFWYCFKEYPGTPLRKLDDDDHDYVYRALYKGPYVYYWPPASTTNTLYYFEGKNVIQEALLEAAVLTYYSALGVCPSSRLDDMLYVRIPFRDNRELEVVGGPNSLKVLSGTDEWSWQQGPSGVQPRRRVTFGDRLPLLVRFRKDGQNGQLAWMMNAGIVSDLVNILPEWAGTEGKARYDGSYVKMAAGELYALPLEESALQEKWCTIVTNSDKR